MLNHHQQLEEARRAYHLLATGRMPRVVVDQNGERVEFTAANRSALYAYVQQLESKVCALKRSHIGPARFLF